MLDIPGAQVWVPLVVFAFGLVGIIVRILPGLLLCLAAVGIWAYDQWGTTAAIILGICVLITAVGIFLQIRIPHRRLREQGVPTSTLLIAIACALALLPAPFFGPPLGFVGGIYGVQRLRTGTHEQAWAQTKAALRALIQSIGIELAAAMVMLTTLITGMVLVR